MTMVEDKVIFNTPGAPGLGRFAPSEDLLKQVVLPAMVVLVVLVGGVGTGWFLSKEPEVGGLQSVKGVATAPGAGSTNGAVGLDDTKTFSDTAEGMLEEGGIDGEGTHHLTRDGGPSQNVYLTSSVLDLEQFVGKKVQVWGQTFSAQKAGWLMDVGKIKELAQ